MLEFTFLEIVNTEVYIFHRSVQNVHISYSMLTWLHDGATLDNSSFESLEKKFQ